MFLVFHYQSFAGNKNDSVLGRIRRKVPVAAKTGTVDDLVNSLLLTADECAEEYKSESTPENQVAKKMYLKRNKLSAVILSYRREELLITY